jgi:hypothetical protein
MRECEQLKRALGVPTESKKTKSSNNDDRNGDQRFDNRNRRPDRCDYCDRRPYRRKTTRIDVVIIATTATMISAKTIVPTTAMTCVTTARVIAVMTSVVTTEMIGMMIDIAMTTTTTTTTIARSDLHRHHLKGATLVMHSNPPTERSTSSSAVSK